MCAEELGTLPPHCVDQNQRRGSPKLVGLHGKRNIASGRIWHIDAYGKANPVFGQKDLQCSWRHHLVMLKNRVQAHNYQLTLVKDLFQA